MARIYVPLRPKGRRKYDLQENEKNCIAWYVLSGCKKEDAYMIFVRPDLAISKKNLSLAATQFFALSDVLDFITAYRATLDGEQEEQEEPVETEDRETRKIKALQKFTDTVVDKMSGDFGSIDEMDSVAKLADRVGVLDDNSKAIVAPQRFLTETCSKCSYRICIEENLSKGNIIDTCDFCKARKYAEEHGWKFDKTTNFDL